MNLFKKISLGILLASSFYTLSQEQILPIEFIREIIQEGIDLDIKDEDGNTLINLLSRGESIEGVDMLASAGADVNLPNNEGDTPLISVACYNYTSQTVEIAQILLDHGADINAQEKISNFTATHCALLNKNIDLALFLIQQDGLDVTLRDEDGDTLLHNLAMLVDMDEIDLNEFIYSPNEFLEEMPYKL